MACQELDAGLTKAAKPAGEFTQTSNPKSANFCRKYDFSGYVLASEIITFAGDDILTFSADTLDLF